MSAEAKVLSSVVPLVEEWRASEAVRKAFEIAASSDSKWSSSWNDDSIKLRFDDYVVLEVFYTFETRIFIEALVHRLNNSTLGKAIQ